MKDLIKKYLQEQIIDKVGETRPYIDSDFIDVYADDIEKLVKNNAILPHVSKRREQLKAFLRWAENEWMEIPPERQWEQMFDEYFKSL
jgi:hypothetical protein